MRYDELYYLNGYHRKQMEQEAEQQRLVRLALSGRPGGHVARPVLAWAGRRMLATGLYLLSVAGETNGGWSAKARISTKNV